MLTQRVQFSHLDGVWIVDDFPTNSSTSQPSIQSQQSGILNELPRNSSTSQLSMQSHQFWVLDELPRNQSISQLSVTVQSMELWISEQIERLRNSDFLQRIRKQLIDLELDTKTKVFDNDNVKDADICPICQAAYEGIERVSTLRCRHEYHTDCIKRWLMLKNACPLCKEAAISSL